MLEYLFAQYITYPTYEIVLEITAVIFGLLSVWYAKKDNILVFPTGLINTALYVFLLWKWSLLGDMMINGYYFVMSIYGWYHWTRKKGDDVAYPIARISSQEKKLSVIIFLLTVIFVVVIYLIFNKPIFDYFNIIIVSIFFFHIHSLIEF